MTLCGELMTSSPSCCRADATVEQAAELMKSANVGLIPVVADRMHKLIGVITDRDIAIKVVADRRDPRTTSVADVMTSDPIACGAHETAEAVMALMAANQVRRIPIVDEGGVIVGIVAQADLATRLGRPDQTGQVVEAISNGDTTAVRVPL